MMKVRCIGASVRQLQEERRWRSINRSGEQVLSGQIALACQQRVVSVEPTPCPHPHSVPATVMRPPLFQPS